MKFLGTLVFSDFKSRLLALALAVVTWVSVYRESTEQVSARARVDLVPAAGVEILSVEDEAGLPCAAVEVVLNGPRGERARLRDMRFSRGVELRKAGETPDTVTFDVTEEALQLPPKFRLVSAKPARIRVKVDARHRQLMRLETAGGGFAEGKPADGMRVTSSSVSPTAVFVEGPRSVLVKHGTIAVVPVKVDGLPAGTHTLVTEIAGNLDGVPVSTASTVTVTVEVSEEERGITLTVPITLVRSEEFVNSRDVVAELGDKEADVEVRGPASAISAMSRESLVVFADVSPLGKDITEPKDEKTPNLVTRPLIVALTSKFAGSEDLKISIRKPEKRETVVTFKRLPKPEAPK